MVEVEQTELEAKWLELSRVDPCAKSNAMRLARFVEAKLLVQERSEVNRLKARLAKLEKVVNGQE